jgi:hypothetical protein
VVVNGSNSNSNWLPVRAGVPQGSILDPLLFKFFINDIVNEINTEIKLFADDANLYLSVDNPNDTAFLLNQDLNKIQRCVTCRGLHVTGVIRFVPELLLWIQVTLCISCF